MKRIIHIPFPFVSNVKIETRHVNTEAGSGRKFYRIQLISSNYLKFNDAVIVIEADPKNPLQTLFTEYDFFETEIPALIRPFVTVNRVWKDAEEGVILADLLIKVRAEHPEWEMKTVRLEAKKLSKEAGTVRTLPAPEMVVNHGELVREKQKGS